MLIFSLTKKIIRKIFSLSRRLVTLTNRIFQKFKHLLLAFKNYCLHFLLNLRHLVTHFPEECTKVFINRILPLIFFIKFIPKKINLKTHNIKSVAFIPYQSPDCIVQHALITNALKAYGISAALITSSVPSDVIEKNPYSGKSFNDLINYLINQSHTDSIFARGLIDEFIRICDVEVFKGRYEISAAFCSLISNIKPYSKSLINPFDAIVLADSAYALNRGIRSSAHKHSIPIYTLNPHGQWFQLRESDDEYYPLDRFKEIISQINDTDHSYRDAILYLDKRFSGQSFADLDSSRAFAPNRSASFGHSITPKKVLFLHSFRDASGMAFPSNTNELYFPTYFQWADAAFNLITQQQEQWIIRPHPSQDNYPNDREILEFLLNKHGINKEIVTADVSTLHILQNKWPVYTCSGTIAFETACFGYKAHTVSLSTPDEVSKRSKTLKDFENNYLAPIHLCSELINDEQLIRAVKIFFAEQYAGYRRSVKPICPQNPVLPSLSALGIYGQKLRALLQMIGICFSKNGLSSANELATEIIVKMSEKR
jgi:hypothetical protein